MRFAAFVVALLVFEVQSQQQCSESLGTCVGSRASLMQVKSFSQKLQTATGRGTSKHAETLAGFQKYTAELVDKYLQAPREDVNYTHSSGLGEEVIAAIKIIRDYLQSLYQDLLLFHYQDGNASAWCAGAAERCVSRDLAEFSGQLPQLNEEVVSAQIAHQKCQGELVEKCNPPPPPPVCPEYHAYRKTPDALFPNCGKAGHLKDDYRNAQYIANAANVKLGDFENCLTSVHNTNWVDALYLHYKSCDDQEETTTQEPDACAKQQTAFEDAVCRRTTLRKGNCDNYDTCMDHAQEHCVTGVAKDQVGVCPQVQANALARQSDNETAERISCLLDVLTAADIEDKGAGLEACHQRDFTQVNAFWEIDCFVRSAGPNGECEPDLEVCSFEFESEHYRPFGHQRGDEEGACCNDGSGKCYNACTPCTPVQIEKR